MRALVAGLGLLAWLVVAGCSDRDPVSSATDDGSEPAGKLVVSGTRAGGYLGRSNLRRLYGQAHQELYDQNLDQFMSYFADAAEYDYVPLPTPMRGKPEIRQFFDDLFYTWPDFRATSEFLLMAGNVVVTEHPTISTHLGEWVLLGISPTGREVPHIHLDIWEFEGQKIKKATTYGDVLSILIGIGALPAPELPPLAPSFALPAPEPTGLSPLRAVAEANSRWNSHDLAEYAKLFHQDAEFFIAPLGAALDRDQFIAVQELYVLGHSDISLEVVRMLDMGDGWVLQEVVFQGTHDGPYFGIPATGRPWATRGAVLSRVDASGLTTHMRVYWDEMTNLVQWGLM